MGENFDETNPAISSGIISSGIIDEGAEHGIEDAMSQIRNRIVDSALLFLVVISFPAIVALTIRGLELGLKPIHYIQGTLYLSMVVPIVFRRYLPFSFRTAVLLSACLIVGLSGIFTFGLMGGSILLLVFACIISTALFGRLYGYISVLVCSAPICVLGIAVVNGYYSFNYDVELYSLAPLSWAVRILGFAGLSAAMVHGSGMLYTHLLGSVRQLSDKTKDLAKTNKLLTDEIAEREQTRTELNTSEEKFRVLSENVSDVVSIVDMDMTTTYVSPSIFEQRGFTPRELLDTPVQNRITPESMTLLSNELTATLAQFERGELDSTASRTTQYEAYRKDGSRI